MKKKDNDGIYIDRELDKINEVGENLGGFLGGLVKNLRKIAIVVGALATVGLMVFIWSVIKGARDKSK